MKKTKTPVPNEPGRKGRRARGRRFWSSEASWPVPPPSVSPVGASPLPATRRTTTSGTPSDGAKGRSTPDHQIVRTPDGAELAVWDLPGDSPEAPVVVLPHCWGCSHEIWLPVARRLREQGYRVVLYDQRGHGLSTRGTAPLALDTLAHDLTEVLEATDVRDVVLAGHSMGGFTVMALATYRPEVLPRAHQGDRARGDGGHGARDRRSGQPPTRRHVHRVTPRHPGAPHEERPSPRAGRLRRQAGTGAHGPDA